MMVIPFSRSRSIESRMRSGTDSLARKSPDCQSMASTSVVLPWSTWAMMATLRTSGRSRIGPSYHALARPAPRRPAPMYPMYNDAHARTLGGAPDAPRPRLARRCGPARRLRSGRPVPRPPPSRRRTAGASGSGSMAWSLLIRGGTVVDGSGAPGRPADVAVAGDRIAAVGPALDGPAARVIDARALAVAPGFIDAHAHSDLFYLECPAAESNLRQG